MRILNITALLMFFAFNTGCGQEGDANKSHSKEIKVAEITQDHYFKAKLRAVEDQVFYGVFALYETDYSVEIKFKELYFRNFSRSFDYIRYEGDQNEGVVSYELETDDEIEAFDIAIFTYDEWRQVLLYVDSWPTSSKSVFETRIVRE